MKMTQDQFKKLVKEQVELQIEMRIIEEGFGWNQFTNMFSGAGKELKGVYGKIKNAARAKAVGQLGEKFGTQVAKLWQQLSAERTKQGFTKDEIQVSNEAIAVGLEKLGSTLKYKFQSSAPAAGAASGAGKVSATATTGKAPVATKPEEEPSYATGRDGE